MNDGAALLLRVRDLMTITVGPISFDLPAGGCLALSGPSGAGKSLTLRAIADLDPNQGEISLKGASRESMSAPAWRRQVGYLPAEPGWWDDRVGAHFEDWAKAAPMIAALGVPAESHDWEVVRLSTGERQRLGLARALALDPRVILLDEPTANLDDEATAAVEKLIAAQRAAGMGVVWVTHDSAQAQRVAQRRLLLTDGKLQDAAA